MEKILINSKLEQKNCLLLIDSIQSNSNIVNILALFSQNVRTVRTEEPNPLEPVTKFTFAMEPVRTGTECCLKFRTGTGEFWNRPSSNVHTLGLESVHTPTATVLKE